MTNAPSTRKTHVIRITGTNKSGDVLQDIWADVERIDIHKSVTQMLNNDWQGYQRKHLWLDDPDQEDNYVANGNPTRLTEIVKVCDPNEADVDDPEEWIPIHVIKSMKGMTSSGTSNTATGTQNRFHTGLDDNVNPTTRVVEVRKINHYDTNIDDEAQAAFDADPSRTAYVVPGSTYQRDDSTKDESQFIDHEIITYLKHRTNENSGVGGNVNRGVQTKLLNQYMIDESDPGNGMVIGATGINPPYRLDPFQNIVNVKFGSTVLVAFVDANGLPAHPSIFNIIAQTGVTYMDRRPITFINPGYVDAVCTIYKVQVSAKNFISITTPDFGTINHQLYAYIFALDQTQIAQSVENIFSVMPQIQYARYLESHDGPPSGPITKAVISPPGLLWSVGMQGLPTGDTRQWKIRSGNHRSNRSPTPPPNSMIQLYPLGSNYLQNTSDTSVTGYQIRMYRLDPKGTGNAYGASNIGADTGAFSGMRMDPAWHQPIVSGVTNGDFGIPFSDPPPLVGADVAFND